MPNTLNINNDMLIWAINRAGFDVNQFVEKNPNVYKWLDGEKDPTVKQLEDFSKKVYLPFGYLFLPEPPKETLPIPYFRSSGHNDKISIHVYDTILLLQRRQDWLRDYLTDNNFEKLPFVGRFKDNFNTTAIVSDIRQTLNLPENWAGRFQNWEDAMNHLVVVIEDKGIITVFNGVVENNNY